MKKNIIYYVLVAPIILFCFTNAELPFAFSTETVCAYGFAEGDIGLENETVLEKELDFMKGFES